MASKDSQIILKELGYIKDELGSFKNKVDSMESDLKKTKENYVTKTDFNKLYNVAEDLAGNYQATEEAQTIQVAWLNRHDHDIGMLKQRAGIK